MCSAKIHNMKIFNILLIFIFTLHSFSEDDAFCRGKMLGKDFALISALRICAGARKSAKNDLHIRSASKTASNCC